MSLFRRFPAFSRYWNCYRCEGYRKYCSHEGQKFGKRTSGPGLKFFIAQSQGRSSVSVPTENVPYLSESDLDGTGRKVYFEVQGCQMNHSDVEVVWSILKSRGYQRSENLMDSDVVLIMTCAIRERAESKIWSKIKSLQGIKKANSLRYKVGILGCMAERLKQEIIETDKTVDLVAGPDSYKDLPRLLALLRQDMKAVNVLLSLDETYADVMPVRLNEESKSAYISIMRGCENMCSYCIVPFTRGKERSRPIQSILEEVRMLSDQGVKEVILLGQNVNSYRDMSSVSYYDIPAEKTNLSSGFKTVYKPKIGGLRFSVLLDKVSEIDPEMRIRFTSPHPKDFPDEVLHLIKERKNICKSIHLPAQSGSNTVLERMRRGYTRESYIDLVHHIRDIIPDVALSTDIICGFCGETEKDHQDTLDLINTVKYNFVYMFPYSMREKTTAHRRYADDVPVDVKKRRTDDVGLAFRRIAQQMFTSQIGETHLVLVEGASKKSPDFLAGRNDANVKVIIPNVRIPARRTESEEQETKSMKPGDYVSVVINNCSSQVLHGTPRYHSTLAAFDATTKRNALLSE